MWCDLYLAEFLQEFLPPGAKLMAFRSEHKRPAAIMRDIDNDGKPEIAAVYRWQDEDYIIVLKNHFNSWYTILNTKANGQSPAYLLRNIEKPVINLYPAPIRTANGVKWGFIDNKGDFIIKPQYDNANDFQANGLAVVGSNNLLGIIDKTGKFIVEPKYGSINEFSEGRAAVVDNEGFKIIDERGNILTLKAYSFIGTFRNGRVLFAGTDPKGNYLYGYLDRQGKEIIPMKYESGTDFNDGKAVVKVKNNQYALIGLNGEVLRTYNYSNVGNLSEGLMAFQKDSDSKFGYIDENNNVIIQPQYTGAQQFKDGVAIVNTASDYNYKYGLIDKKGNFLIKPGYDSMYSLGENRLAVGRAINPQKPFLGYKYAVADTNGKLLTDFIYSDLSNYNGGLASAYDNKNTFFIDKSGKIVRTLPIVSGGGTLYIVGDLVKAFVDYRTTYYDKSGAIVYKENTVIPLNTQYKVNEEKFKPNKDYLVYYPQIEGIKNRTIQQSVNKRLKTLSGVKNVNPNVQLESSYSGDFSVKFFKKNLLVLELSGYDFPFGAAHGMPSEVYPHIDLVSGRFYALKDLFKQNSNYVKVLSDIIGEQIKNDPQYSYVFPDTYKGIKPDQPFYVDENNLYIYFTPYEIAPYAAGFPTFKIPFSSIMNIININGQFWKAFN